MSIAQFTNEPIEVIARFLCDGQIQPVAFVWRQRTQHVAGIGRQWQEETDGIVCQCYLVMTPAAETFELRFHPASGRWVLYRAWPGSFAVV